MKLGIGIISAGKVGSVLGAALQRAGHTIVAVHAASDEAKERADVMLPGTRVADVEEIVRVSELVILALPGREIQPLVEGLAAMGAWQPGQLVVHTHGGAGTEILQAAKDAGALVLALHPALVLTGTSLDLDRLSGARFAVSGPDMLLPIGHALVSDMGGVALTVPNEKRAQYQAALQIGSSVGVLVDRARRILDDIEVEDPQQLLAPIIASVIETGRYGIDPHRVDDESQEADLTALAGHDIDQDLYRALMDAARDSLDRMSINED